MAVSDLANWIHTKYYNNVNVPIALASGQARAYHRTARIDHPDKAPLQRGMAFPEERKVDGVGVVKHRREMSTDFLDLAISDVGIEDLGEDFKLALARQLFVIEIIGIYNDSIT
jgi:hypothetical protein